LDWLLLLVGGGAVCVVVRPIVGCVVAGVLALDGERDRLFDLRFFFVVAFREDGLDDDAALAGVVTRRIPPGGGCTETPSDVIAGDEDGPTWGR
jgi:hypothetical protein